MIRITNLINSATSQFLFEILFSKVISQHDYSKLYFSKTYLSEIHSSMYDSPIPLEELSISHPKF